MAQEPALPSGLEPALPSGLPDSEKSEESSDEPSLPMGLGGDGTMEEAEPSLPSGLGGGADVSPGLPSGLPGVDMDEPGLPAGLDAGADAAGRDDSPEDSGFLKFREGLPFDLTGFAETRVGPRLRDKTDQKDMSIGELRLHLESVYSREGVTATLVSDFLYDPVMDEHGVDLESGQGWFDLREANLLTRPFGFMDIKFGRQILTWGTGDLIFINDLFPKDWNSFLIGRDEEYLKAPSDALKVSLFHDIANLDLVYTPQFDADRYVDGRRLSYFNMNTASVVGQGTPVLTDHPGRWFSDDEFAARLHRMAGAWETALYFYHGFWKSPAGFSPASGLFTFPELSVSGGSLRGPLAGGIANLEFGYYDSADDRSGSDPLIRNSEIRFLAGFEREVLPELTAGVQYYLEHMLDHDNYVATLPAPLPQLDRNRHLLTLRLTKLMMNQNLTLSLFTFYSPSDNDLYLRPEASYKISDSWSVEAGGNIFTGEDSHTFFGQFADNTNIYIAFRYGF